MNKLVAALVLFCATQTLTALTILCEDDPPFQLKTEQGTLSGFTVELVRAIQKEVGNSDPIALVPWPRGYAMAQTEKDVVLFSMMRTAERNPRFHWVGPIKETRWIFVLRANSPIKLASLDDARKLKTLAVPRNDARDEFLTKMGFTNLVRVTENQQAAKMLLSGRVDAYVSSDNALPEDLKAAGADLKGIQRSLAFNRYQIYIAISKATNPAVAAAWNQALDKFKKNGTFQALFARWFPGHDLPGPALTEF